MSAIIESCAGYIHIFSDSGGGTSFLKIDPPLPDNGDGGKCIITGAPINLREIVQPSVTLNDKRTIYVFGSAWAEGSVSGIMLLGKDGSGGGIAGDLKGWYESNRISKKMSPVTLSIASAKFTSYVTGLSFGESQPEFNKMSFSISFLISLE